MKIRVKKIIVPLFSTLFILAISYSCKKVGGVTYPTSANYGENIFNVPNGKLTAFESYSFEANLGKNTTLTVKVTNLSETVEDPTITQQPRWVYDYLKGWKPDNYVNKVQIFETNQVGNNDFKIVFVGQNGSCRIDVMENGRPSFIKYFTW